MPKSLIIRKTIDKEIPNLADKIKEARVKDKRSLVKICQEMGMTPMNWYRIEKAETKTVPLETLKRIEEVLGIDFGIQFNDAK